MQNGDDSSLRITNLMFALYSSPSPLTTEQIVSDSDLGYGSSNRASDLKKFSRDREQLASHGVYVQEIRREGSSKTEESSWAIDRARSYANRRALSPEDADILDAILEGQLARTDLPYRPVLNSIRTKLHETVGAPAGACASAGVPEPPDPVVDAVWAAFSLRRLLPFQYHSASGRDSRRTIAIYGVFTVGGTCYFVGMCEGEAEVRTFRTDRVRHVWRPRGSYAIPADFRIDDYLFLPFDFSDGEGIEATFRVPAGVGRGELETLSHRRGSLERQDDGSWIWRVDVRDLGAAAAFCLSNARLGMRPESPAGLLETWNSLLAWEVNVHANGR